MHTLVRVKNAYTVMTICLIALGGPAPDELSRCREQVKTTLLMGLERIGRAHV